jgi:hypothetical protein
MPQNDDQNPVSPEPVGEPESDEELGVSARLGRVFGALQQALAGREGAASWLSAGLSLLGALQKLGGTVARLIRHARRVAKENAAAGPDAARAELVDAEILEEIREQFRDLLDGFPEAGDLFFGVDELDDFMRELISGDAPNSLLRGLEQLGEFLETRMNRLVGRLIDYGFEEHAQTLSIERLEEFIRGTESLLQEVLDRWVIPEIYDLGDNKRNDNEEDESK